MSYIHMMYDLYVIHIYDLYDIHDMVRGILYNDANACVYTMVPTHVCIQIYAGFGVTLPIDDLSACETDAGARGSAFGHA